MLPLSLTVGAWLLGRAGIGAGAGEPGHGPPVLLQAVDQRASADDCLKLGAAIAERAPRVALLAMGDASARRARDIEGAPDRLAQEYDEEVAEALAAADARWLAGWTPARRRADGGGPGRLAGTGRRGRRREDVRPAALHGQPLRRHVPGRLLGEPRAG